MIINCNTTRYISEVLEREEYKFLFNNLTIIDAGCNVGTFSLYMLPFAEKIYGLDISEENISLFDKTIVENGITNIKTFCVGLTGESGVKHISKDGSAGKGGWQLGNAGTDTIKALSLKEFMEDERIEACDLLKLDVEGSELDIVNATDFPKDKVRAIVGEIHYSDSRLQDFKNRLIKLGYRYFEYPNNHFLARK